MTKLYTYLIDSPSGTYRPNKVFTNLDLVREDLLDVYGGYFLSEDPVMQECVIYTIGECLKEENINEYVSSHNCKYTELKVHTIDLVS